MSPQHTKHVIYTDIEEQRIITDFASDPKKLLALADARARRPAPVSPAFIEYVTNFADTLNDRAALMIHQARQLYNAAQALTDLNSPETEETNAHDSTRSQQDS